MPYNGMTLSGVREITSLILVLGNGMEVAKNTQLNNLYSWLIVIRGRIKHLGCTLGDFVRPFFIEALIRLNDGEVPGCSGACLAQTTGSRI